MNVGVLNYADARPDAPWTGTTRTTLEYRNHLVAIGQDPDLSHFIGWHTQSLYEDWVHDNLLGLGQCVAGSALVTLAREDVWGPGPGHGPWQNRLNA